MGEISRANRKFELFLFDGVPERSKATYGRGAHSRAQGRETGLPIDEHTEIETEIEGKVVCAYSYKPEIEQVVFRPLSQEEKEELAKKGILYEPDE